MSKTSVVLIGMPGAGKSTVGVLLAKALGLGFVDTDICIQQQANRTLQEILDDDGIDSFLHIEEEAVCALQVDDCVIATGGSVVYSAIAMNALKQNAVIIYLKNSFKEIERRLANICSRGVVMKEGSTLHDIYLERSPLYELYADYSIDCSELDTEACVEAVMRVLAESQTV